MCANLEIYNKVRSVPPDATKPIQAGRLKGMTDINPMWRIKTLTEMFGICGFGWRTEIVEQWLADGSEGETVANVKINLFVKHPETGEWSGAIVGIGGAKFTTNETKGVYTDDEAYKKAYTDAISIACKALGVGADVYYSKDSSKYDELPFPEVKNKKAETVKPSAPNPATIQCKIKTREDAKKYKLSDGRLLTDVYKTDRATFMILRDNPPDRDCAEAARLIWEWVQEAQAAKGGVQNA